LAILNSLVFEEGSEAAAKNQEAIASLVESTRAFETELSGLQSANNELLQEFKNTVSEMVKNELQQQVQLEQDKLKSAKEYLDAQLKQIDAEQKLLQYQKNKEKSLRSLTRLRQEEASLQVAAAQGDRRAQAMLIDVQDKIIEEEENKEKLITDFSIEQQKERLNEQYKMFEDMQNAQIKKVQDTMNDAQHIARETTRRINEAIKGNMETLFNEISAYNKEHGNTLTDTVIAQWKEVLALVDEYSNKTGSFSFSGAPSPITGSGIPGGGTTGQSKVDSVIAQMKEVGKGWAEADAATKKAMNEKNKQLAATIGYKYYPADGGYYPEDMYDLISTMSKDQRKKFALYDNGGFKPKGVMGLMGEDTAEWMLTDMQFRYSQQSAIKEFLNQLPETSTLSGPTIPPIEVHIHGNATDEAIAKMSNELRAVVKEVSKGQLDAWKTRGVSPKIRNR
jgi:hypothetical protein